jgi:hypothetical protein
MRINEIIVLIAVFGSFVSHSSKVNRGSGSLVEPRALQQSSIEEAIVNPIQASNRCFTPTFWCYLPGYAPVNARCWCATPNGPVAGIVR